jgi:hypothetical protein
VAGEGGVALSLCSAVIQNLDNAAVWFPHTAGGLVEAWTVKLDVADEPTME